MKKGKIWELQISKLDGSSPPTKKNLEIAGLKICSSSRNDLEIWADFLKTTSAMKRC